MTQLDLADLKAKAEAAMKRAPGLWGSDIEKGDGEYGDGDDCRTGFMVPYMETEHGKRLFDAHYCDVAEVQEDYDSDDDGGCSIYAWDQASKEIFDFLAAVQPATILALIAEIERRDQGGVAECENCDGEGTIEYEGGDGEGWPSKPERDTCLKCRGSGRAAPPASAPDPALAQPNGDALRVAREAIRAEINAPLQGPTHGAWDRGRIAGLKEALAALSATPGGEPDRLAVAVDSINRIERIERILTDPVPGYSTRIATARVEIASALAALKGG